MFFPDQGRGGEHQTLYCNSSFDFGVQQIHGVPVRQGWYFLIWFIQIMYATEGAICTVSQNVRAPASLFGFYFLYSSSEWGVAYKLDVKRHYKTSRHSCFLKPDCCWGAMSVPPPQDSADPSVLSIAGDDADADESAEEDGSSGGVASLTRTRTRSGGGAATATPPLAAAVALLHRRRRRPGKRRRRHLPRCCRHCCGPSRSRAAAAAAAPGVLDMKDFTAWTQGTWELLPWDEIHFPKDPNVSICSVRQVLSVSMPVGLCLSCFCCACQSLLHGWFCQERIYHRL